MARRIGAMLAGLAVVGVGLGLEAARGQDFGKMFEKAAKKAVKNALAPSGGPVPGQPASGIAGAARGEAVPLKTQDGWTLVMHHYSPTAAAKPGAMPVILCHGLTYNASFWDLDPACSFATYLAGQGHDVWSLDLRGSGMSQKWVWKLDEAPDMLIGSAIRKISKGKIAPTGYASADPKYANWSLDHHIAYDVPAAVKFVRRHTKAPEVAWIGHSMGGIVALGHLARYPNPGIGKLVTVGSQVTMPNGQVPLQFLGEMMQTRQLELTGQLQGAQLVDATKTSVHNLFFNTQNVEPSIYEALSGPATDIPGMDLMKQYSVLGHRGELLDARQQYSYAQNLGNIKVPIFISCGAADSFAPPEAQQFLYDHVGSTDKTLVIFGKAQGYAVDAGHDDALVGQNSQAQVYPVIEKWLSGTR